MVEKTGRSAWLLAAAVQFLVLLPYAGPAQAQHRDGYRAGWDRGYEDRQRERTAQTRSMPRLSLKAPDSAPPAATTPGRR